MSFIYKGTVLILWRYCYRVTLSNEYHIYFLSIVRLSGGITTGEGRIEIFHESQWGTLCGNKGFRRQEATVLCKQLGYHSGVGLLTVDRGTFIELVQDQYYTQFSGVTM